ncbi:MAG TPA: hypothetical protein VFW92_10000 [Candidatus Limnocylindrales bacterium]|nr:hypothetical protein [Candidatus Limnocylindrales bacterium]
MSRHRGTQRLLGPPLAALLLVLSFGAHGAAAYQGSAYENYTAFQSCMGWASGMTDTMRAQAVSALAALGYSTTWYRRTAFTRSRVLSRAGADQAVYVQSHGDQYYKGAPTKVQGFRQDGGACSGAPIVYATDIDARRSSTAAHIVVMSTCHLGEAAATQGQITMSQAYGIAQRRSSRTDSVGYGPEFYLSYIGDAWLDDQLKFERSFWHYAATSSTLGQAFDLALATSGKAARTTPTWFGTYLYSGFPWAPSPPCTRCA